MTKYWCTLIGTQHRRQVGIVECSECDRLAGYEVGAFDFCEARHPYVMPIVEKLREVRWWLKLLWEEPLAFP
jgi:hypothetical protein